MLLSIAQARTHGYVFACFLPAGWPLASECIDDLPARTCIVSLLNERGRPFRLLQISRTTASRTGSSGSIGNGDGTFEINFSDRRGIHEKCLCRVKLPRHSPFKFDTEAERVAGLTPLGFAFHPSLLSGIKGDGASDWFSVDQVNCYVID